MHEVDIGRLLHHFTYHEAPQTIGLQNNKSEGKETGETGLAHNMYMLFLI